MSAGPLHLRSGLSCYNRSVSKDIEETGVSGTPVNRCQGERLVDRLTGVSGVRAYVLVVSGRVQRVGFRWYTEREASKRNVRGYVRNLDDGRVEILAQALPSALDEFIECIRRGPAGSRVDDVESIPIDVDPGLSSFRVTL